ncbi:MAG: hypothetical protein NC548_32305 [Lachnospiraceae bacterium]|nr:hypothetical protein [Lachnospiraceae bacterium]
MAEVLVYDLAKQALNIVGIPNLNRIDFGNLALEKLTGQDRITIVPTETGSDVLQFHSQSESYEVTVEVPRGHYSAMKLYSILREWEKDGNWMTRVSMSVRLDSNVTLTSNECVFERYDWTRSGLTTPGATLAIRIKMANTETVIKDIE